MITEFVSGTAPAAGFVGDIDTKNRWLAPFRSQNFVEFRAIIYLSTDFAIVRWRSTHAGPDVRHEYVDYSK